MLPYIFRRGLLCYLFLTTCIAFAQRSDTLELQDGDERPRYEGFAPTALRLGVSVNDLINTFSDPQTTVYGFQLDVPIRQYMLVFDYGSAQVDLLNEQTDQPDRNFDYRSQGSFFRAGIDANLLKDRQTNSNDASDNVIFFGLKYARSRLSDQVGFRPTGEDEGVTSAIYDITQITERNEQFATWWLEMNAGVKVSVLGNVFLGYTLRYKFLRQSNTRGSLVPYEIPGFGDGNKESAFGFDYYIYYRIPFRRNK